MTAENIIPIQRPIVGVLADCTAIAQQSRDAADHGPLITVERAAQLAERANIYLGHDGADRSADYLDGFTAGFERAAAIIRAWPTRPDR